MDSSHFRNSVCRLSREQLPQRPSRIQKRHLRRLHNQSLADTGIHWNPGHNNPNVINIKRLFTSQNERKQRENLSIDDHIIINVCGDRYETLRTTLERFPNTLLGNEKYRQYYYDEHRKEYFFDRHRACFEVILYYYQSRGRLRRPDFIPVDVFLEEVTFFRLGQEALDQIYRDENLKEIKKAHLPKNPVRRYVWATTEYPTYSLTAKIFNIISLIMALMSAIGVAIESLPQYAHLDHFDCKNTSIVSIINNNTEYTSSLSDMNTCHMYFTSAFFILQCVCIGFFTLEIFVRLLSTPSLLNYIKKPMNWVDIIAVIPFYIRIGIHYAGHNEVLDSHSYAILRPLRILRLARVFRFCQLFKSIKSLRALLTTIRQSLLDFFIMITILTLFAFILGAAAYYAENETNGDEFDSIFKATYWGIITITSVGYGDIVPITPIGRIIASLCSLLGAATIGILVSVLVDRYQRVYARILFINDDEINFSDFSDDENDDLSLSSRTNFLGRRRSTKIEDPDTDAKENNILDTPQTIDTQIEDEEEEDNSTQENNNNNRIHFIIGYVDDDKQETTRNLVAKLSSAVEEEQSLGNDISLNIISNQEDVNNDNENSIQNGVIKNFQFPISKTEEEF